MNYKHNKTAENGKKNWLTFASNRLTWPMTGADPGGSWGADDPSFSLKVMASFRKIEPFSLAKLQLLQIFQVIAASSIVNSPQKFKI